jgi:tripartite-type tricarboxylate transporter receptor subunit TctC
MTKVSFSASVFVIALTSMWHTAQLSFAQDFYAGKTIRIIVGFPAGGGFDTYSRIIGRHFGKFIPGNPAVVVDNVTGAGSLVAANMIYKVAKPDGLTIGNFIGNLVSQQLFGGPGVEFDARKFEWIGVPTREGIPPAAPLASHAAVDGRWR